MKLILQKVFNSEMICASIDSEFDYLHSLMNRYFKKEYDEITKVWILKPDCIIAFKECFYELLGENEND
jgi:hypothetical protein